ncbi:MAG: tetratricopeptide repeat protein [Synechococcaceae cyanobacterium SM2_3_1]|nr:tetratricopeptide repeat protein [Synechococcaceae cyanobacterium SM2_3_1]
MGMPKFLQDQTLQLAQDYYRLGYWQQAAQLYQEVLAADAEVTAALAGLAGLAQDQGDLVTAQSLLRRAVVQCPQSVSLQMQLADVYRAQRQWSEAIRCYQALEALELVSAQERVRLHTRWAQVLQAMGALEQAAVHVQQAIIEDPTAAHLYASLGYLRSLQEDWPEATSCYQRALQLNPHLPDVHNGLGHVLLSQSAWIEASLAFEQALQEDPSNQAALAHLVIALREADQSARIPSWLNYDQLVQVYSCASPPAGYSSVADLNRILVQRLLQHPSLVWNPESLSTWGGLQTTDLLADPALSEPIRDLIRPYVQNYLQALPQDRDHPLQWNRPQELRLGWLWGVSLHPQGYQRLHIHDPAWLSGVYYIQVPAMMGAAGAGCLEFSQTPAEYPITETLSSKRIHPENGLLVLFPGYFYHRTIPFLAGEPRISISFNIAGRLGCPPTALPL